LKVFTFVSVDATLISLSSLSHFDPSTRIFLFDSNNWTLEVTRFYNQRAILSFTTMFSFTTLLSDTILTSWSFDHFTTERVFNCRNISSEFTNSFGVTTDISTANGFPTATFLNFFVLTFLDPFAFEFWEFSDN
jgi:hypothetical protein